MGKRPIISDESKMLTQGYTPGKGLGKAKNGILHPIPNVGQIDRKGKFLILAIDMPALQLCADPITWKSHKSVWIDQWLLTSEKLEAAQKLVKEQLTARHIIESNSPWNTPIFVIKKKSGKWRLLRAVNVTMVLMEPYNQGCHLL